MILISFWATWCSPCIREAPALQKLYEEYADRVFVLAVNTGEDRNVVQAFLAENDYAYPIAYDDDWTVIETYQVSNIPYTLLVNPDGMIAEIIVGSRDADAQYERFQAAIDAAWEG